VSRQPPPYFRVFFEGFPDPPRIILSDNQDREPAMEPAPKTRNEHETAYESIGPPRHGIRHPYSASRFIGADGFWRY
jgi:hypothetical protein